MDISSAKHAVYCISTTTALYRQNTCLREEKLLNTNIITVIQLLFFQKLSEVIETSRSFQEHHSNSCYYFEKDWNETQISYFEF